MTLTRTGGDVVNIDNDKIELSTGSFATVIASNSYIFQDGTSQRTAIYSSGTLASGSTIYIQNSSTLQSGATFYTSSGTATSFTASSITATNIFTDSITARGVLPLVVSSGTDFNGRILGQGLIEPTATPPAIFENGTFLNYRNNENKWSGIGGYTNGGMWFRAQDYSFWSSPNGNSPMNSITFFRSDGWVGIGTGTITNRLVINEDIGATGVAAATVMIGNRTGNSIYSLGQDNANRFVIRWNYNASTTSASVSLFNNVAARDIRLQETGGNIIIGAAAAATSKFDLRNGSITISGTGAGITVTGGTVTTVGISADTYTTRGVPLLVSSMSIYGYAGYILYTATGAIAANTTITISTASTAMQALGVPVCGELEGVNTATVSVRVKSLSGLPNSFTVFNADVLNDKNYTCIFPARP